MSVDANTPSLVINSFDPKKAVRFTKSSPKGEPPSSNAAMPQNHNIILHPSNLSHIAKNGARMRPGVQSTTSQATQKLFNLKKAVRFTHLSQTGRPPVPTPATPQHPQIILHPSNLPHIAKNGAGTRPCVQSTTPQLPKISFDPKRTIRLTNSTQREDPPVPTPQRRKPFHIH